MTISSSLNAGVAGLSANATRLGAISDNIANASTAGYKRMKTDFFSMVVSDGGSSYSAGGVRTTTSRLIDQGGSIVGSANATDIAVGGKGFLPVALLSEVTGGVGQPQTYFTTTGAFAPDEQGYLVSEAGVVLMGWPADENGEVPSFPRDTAEALEPVRLSLNELIAEPSTRIDLGVNLPASDAQVGSAPGTNYPLSVEYFDAFGGSQSLGMTFTSQAPTANTWEVEITAPPVTGPGPGTVIATLTLDFLNGPASGGALNTITDVAPVAPQPAPVIDAAAGTVTVTIVDPTTAPASGPGDQQLTINLRPAGSSSGMTQLGDTFAPLSIGRDGNEMGSMVGAEIDANGFVTAFFDNGSTKTIYQVPLADIPNPNGMRTLDRQLYSTTPDSGRFILWNAGTGPTGEIIPFAREESATDVAGELTDMIQTQRAYSSNAKVIQTVDEMLQETTNIKR
jgi:flagellar hook protein FlgE